MISYASRCQEERGVVTFDVEIVEPEVSKLLKAKQIQSETMYANLDDVTAAVGETAEGDILVVEHDGINIIKFLSKDDEEKQRRIEILSQMM